MWNTIKYYPNPVKNILIIESADGANIEMFDFSGKMVFRNGIMNTVDQIDLSQLSSGSYIVNITGSSINRQFKIIITK